MRTGLQVSLCSATSVVFFPIESPVLPTKGDPVYMFDFPFGLSL